VIKAVQAFIIAILVSLPACTFFQKQKYETPVREPKKEALHAAMEVKKALSLKGLVFAKKLTGGHSGARLFVVTAGPKKYVIRFLKNVSQEQKQKEIALASIASESGYGPHIYYADSKKGIVIMDYLKAKKISDQQRQSKQLYVALANILRKIHCGPPFCQARSPFDKFRIKVERVAKYGVDAYIPLKKMEHIVSCIHKAFLPCLTFAPCHNDLHLFNLIFLENGEFKAIDFDNAGQSNPYYDIAVVALFYCVDPAHEKSLLSAYLGRKPFVHEKAKLFLMKQVALLIFALGALKSIIEKAPLYETVHVSCKNWYVFLKKLLKGLSDGTIKLRNPEYKLKLVKSMIAHVISNAMTARYSNAIRNVRKSSIKK